MSHPADAGHNEQPDRPASDIGGDPACWLSRVCPECGLFAEAEPPTNCPRCGAEVPGQ